MQIFYFLFPSSSLGTQLCRSSSFGEAVPKPKLGNERKDHFEILASSLERQRVSAVAGGKLELPGQGVPKLELGNEGKFHIRVFADLIFSFDVRCSMFDVHL
ncbi:hypothetical protein FDQ92_00135 [Desulfoglaeba alkanexedens ALDC]|uniref:Uncharacterized protein n=1 Tax=Desulfoglaeba alkanexedens ALDC TaxID=980445 RepID=A0A4P8KZ09_9BACT|nr:hypothetical protein FDQ92_00135 [Desulfoglaeba alkanexedens ALDC]